MAQGTLANLSTSAFVRTPPLFAEWIVHHLLTFPAGDAITILDPTAGEGDLLAPANGRNTASSPMPENCSCPAVSWWQLSRPDLPGMVP